MSRSKEEILANWIVVKEAGVPASNFRAGLNPQNQPIFDAIEHNLRIAEFTKAWNAAKEAGKEPQFMEQISPKNRKLFSALIETRKRPNTKVPRRNNVATMVPAIDKRFSLSRGYFAAPKKLKDKEAYIAGLSAEDEQILYTWLSRSELFTPKMASVFKRATKTAATAAAAVRPVGIEGFCPLVNIYMNCYQNAAMQVLHSIPELAAFFSTNRSDAIDEAADAANRLVQAVRDAKQVAAAASVTAKANPLNAALKEQKDRRDEELARATAALPCFEYSEAVPRLFHLLNIFFMEYAKAGAEGRVLNIERLTNKQYPGTIRENLYIDLLNLLGFPLRTQSDAGEYFTQILPRLQCFPTLLPIGSLVSFVTLETRFCDNQRQVVNRSTAVLQKLDIQDPAIVSVSSALDKLQAKKEEVVERVESCGYGNQTHIQQTIESPASQKYLFLELQRVVSDLDAEGKMQWVEIDGRPVIKQKKLAKGITLDPVIVVGGSRFQLKMAVHHGGGAQGGHYISYSFNPDGTPNVCFNDSRIHKAEADATALLLENATVLLYEKIPAAGGRRVTTRRKQKKSSKRGTRKH